MVLLQERRITAYCKKDYRKTIQLYPDRKEFFAEHGYEKGELCLAKKKIDEKNISYIVSIRWHDFTLSEEEFLKHFTVYYEQGLLNGCVKNGTPCEYLRSYMGSFGHSNEKYDHYCHHSQDVGRATCRHYS